MHQFIVLVLALFAAVHAQPNGVWTAKKNMLYQRSDHTANIVPFAGNVPRVVVFGGCVGNNICTADLCYCDQITNKTTVYVPNADAWAELPEAPLARYRHSAAVIGSSLYVFGGRDLADNIITDVHVFSAITGQWSVATSWPDATSDLTSVMYNNTIYAIGGYDAGYDSQATTWTFRPLDPTPQWRVGEIANMNVARGDSCSVLVNGRAYVFGGWDSNFCTPLDDVESYDFITNTWTTHTDMVTQGGDKGCAALHNEIHVFGGEQKDRPVNCSVISVPLNNVEVFDAVSRTWTTETQMPVARFRFAAVAWSTNSSHDELIIFGGQGPYNATISGNKLLDRVATFADSTPNPPAVTTSTSGQSVSAAGQTSVSVAALAVFVGLAVLLA